MLWLSERPRRGAHCICPSQVQLQQTASTLEKNDSGEAVSLGGKKTLSHPALVAHLQNVASIRNILFKTGKATDCQLLSHRSC